MECGKCSATIEAGEEREYRGRMLCEDCYMDALSPTKTCDPWAVYSAKSLQQHMGGALTLTPIQCEILHVLKEAGSLEPSALLSRLGDKLTLKELEREFATLRHMEKVRGEKQSDRVVWRLW